SVYAVTSYGAACNGVADDTAAILATWAAAPAGAEVDYPLGICIVSALTHPAKPLRHVGVSVSGSIIRGRSPRNATFALISTAAQPTRLEHLRIENTAGGTAILISNLRTVLNDVHAESVAIGGGTGILVTFLVGVEWANVYAYGTT